MAGNTLQELPLSLHSSHSQSCGLLQPHLRWGEGVMSEVRDGGRESGKLMGINGVMLGACGPPRG